MKRLLCLLPCVALLLMQACHPEPYLTVSPTNLSFNQDGGTQTVRVSANYPWMASASGTGISVSPATGEGDATVTINVSPASSTDETKGTVSFQSEGLTASVAVSQEAKSSITVGVVNKIPAEGGTFTVDIQYNTDFSVEIESAASSWITFKGTKAMSSGKLEFSFAANNNPDPRTGKVTVKDKGGKAAPITLTFEQEEIKVLEVGDTMPIPAEGGTFEVDVKFNTDFTVEVEPTAQSWITFVKTKALQSGKLEFSFAANENPDARTGTVTVKDKSGKAAPITLTFVQEEKRIIETLEEDEIQIPERGGLLEVGIKYNTEYTVEVESDARSWVRFVQTKAISAGYLQFMIEANEGEQRTGHVTVKDKAGKAAPKTLTFVQEAQSREWKARRIMERVYEAWGAREWKNEPWIPGENWPGFYYDYQTEAGYFWTYDFGITREMPECIGELGDLLGEIHIREEPGLTGTLPDSFRKLTGLRRVSIQLTGMTSIPDVFGDMKQLEELFIATNRSMAGPLPKHINSPVLENLLFAECMFSGEIPDTWAPYIGIAKVFGNCLGGKISQLLHNADEVKAFVQNSNLWQQTGYGFDISDLDIPGTDFWFEDKLLENLDGTTFSIPEVVSQNKYTVYIFWATWCPFSKELMPALKRYYDLYKQDGLEVIATIQVDEDFNLFYDYEKQKKECIDKGYDQWYNYYFTKYDQAYFMSVPVAEVYDQKGNILFSSWGTYPDPVRNRFGKTASSDLIPFLETLLGPAEIPDTYESTDYSKDGEVMTLQKATVGDGIDIVFLGDAYTDRDMGNGGLYETVMKQSMEEFFAIEPYKSFRNRFNVYAVKVVSKNSRIGEGCETALATQFGIGSEVWGDYDKCVAYAKKIPSIKNQDNLAIAVLVNSRRHAGMTQLNAEHQSGIAFLSANGNDPELFGSTLRHELGGHGMAFLADEYATYSGSAPASHITYYNDVYKKYGWFANVDFTNDKSKVRWSAFLSDERYKGEVGIFEGGALYEKGAYRPSENSMMNMNFEYFNAPSRWAIYQQIMKRSGEEASFEKFLEYDAVNRAAASHSATAAAARPPMKAAANSPHRTFIPTAPPVIVK
ncbi:MAG: redoxin domain-containing protein [Bacteroidales bacterium]|nr:redoxin domain-containing protein [Bacteroidales bacterium]